MRKVIYTVLTGNYDHLAQPAVTDPSFDYVCFTDAAEGCDGVWQLRPIPFEGTPVMRARWAKLHPYLLLPEYDLSVFMDANLCITGAGFYERIKACDAPYAVLDHCVRDCVWEELRYCYLKDKIGTEAALRWHKELNQMQMPRHFGLAETNVLVRRHGMDAVRNLDRCWWELLLLSGGTRDQLTFTPALHRRGLSMPPLLLGPGRNARNVAFLAYTLHPQIGKEHAPGKLNWFNIRYHLRLLWRKMVLLCLK